MNSFVRQNQPHEQQSYFYLNFGSFFFFSPKTKTLKKQINKTNAKSTSKTIAKIKQVRHRSTDHPSELEPNDINAYLLFVYFCIILRQGKIKEKIER